MDFAEIRRKAEETRMLNPEYRDCFGCYSVVNDKEYFNPGRSLETLFSIQDLRRFLKRKDLPGKKTEKDIMSVVDGLIARMEETRSVANFIPCSGWLPAGEQYPDGYSSLLVGKGFEKPEIADIPSPSFDAYEQIVFNKKERKIFRALLAAVLKGLLLETPVELPVLVLAGGKDAGRHYLKNLISVLFGKGINYAASRNSKDTTYTAASVFWYVNDFDITAKNGVANFRTLRTFAKNPELIVSRKSREYPIPAFTFMVMLAQVTPDCLVALPHPGNDEEHAKGVIVLSCDQKVSIMPRLNPAERPGYFKRLLEEESKIPSWYFAEDIQEAKFQSLKEYNIYVKLKNLGQGKREIQPISDIASALEGVKTLQTYAIQGGGETNVMKLLARYRPKEIRQVDGENWQLDFTNI